MKNKLLHKTLTILICFSSCLINIMYVYCLEQYRIEDKIDQIELFINEQMQLGKIPGLSVVIIKSDEIVYSRGFGYADIDKEIPVTEDSLFEIGSTSKAFTGLGLLLLENDGLLSLNDPVKAYIPWFRTKYKGEYVDITVAQCLYQTCGIPFKSIDKIPVAEDDKALENTVKTLIDIELDFYPGSKYLYATINYDILGLMIEYVSKQSFEEFMIKKIFQPLGLNSTYIYRDEVYNQKQMVTGYKLGCLSQYKYNAPTYRGNSPAGYVILNTRDLSQWIKMQMNSIPVPDPFSSLMRRSHKPDRTVSPASNGSSYASGWEIFQDKKGLIAHAGANPNFSSYIIFRPYEKIGIGIMANLNSAYTSVIGDGILSILENRKVTKIHSDMYIDLDNMGFAVLVSTGLLILITFVFLIILVKDLASKKRELSSLKLKNILGIIFNIIFIFGIAFCLYMIPKVIFWDLSWNFIHVWGPFSFIPAVILLFLLVLILSIYFQIIFCFPKKNEKPFFPLIILSFLSGFGNAFIIFTINEALNRVKSIETGLWIYFILGIILYVLGQKLIRKKMIIITNDLIYEKRMKLIDSIIGTSYYKIESIEDGKIHAGLSHDTVVLSNLPEVIINCLTAFLTLLCCFVYLGIVNSLGLIISVFIISIAASLYYIAGRKANILWEKARDIQNVFFRYINALIKGFKELSLNFLKRYDFKKDMEKSCDDYRKKQIRASVQFANVFVIGELLFTIVIGFVAFVFPVLFKEIQTHTLRTYIFVFLFMTGPVNGILHTIPQLINMKISWKRMNALIDEISELSSKDIINRVHNNSFKRYVMRLDDVEYTYNFDNHFKVGPINYEFRSGEIYFITGGNGSGKTTLLKLMTGLYKSDKGNIYVNEKEFKHTELGELYSNVLNDFYLFKKLYGIKEINQNIVNKYLKILQIDTKLKINNGEFSTLDLSNGQKKRIALLVSYLENKPFFIFDEWAADQDPEFRKFFYHKLIQKLKASGKCVIAITHDDHYFHAADHIIKMNMGSIETC